MSGANPSFGSEQSNGAKHVTACRSLIVYCCHAKNFQRKRHCDCTSRLASLSISCGFRTMSEKLVKQKKSFGRKPTSRRRHLNLARSAIGKRQKSGDEAGEALPSSTNLPPNPRELSVSTTHPTDVVVICVHYAFLLMTGGKLILRASY